MARADVRRLASSLAAFGLLAGLVACTGTESSDQPSSGASSAAVATTSDVPPSSPASTSASSPSATTKPPVAPKTTVQAGAACPYLANDFVELTAGQHISSSNLLVTTPAEGPLPQCDFLRSNGEVVLSVRTVTKTDAVEAQNAALGVAPDGNPVTDIGDGGVVKVMLGKGSTVLAISKGAVVVVVTVNQESSLEAREIATEVVTKF